MRTSPPLAADEIRRQADNFVDLAEFRSEIERARVHNGRDMSRTPVDAVEAGDDADDDADEDIAGDVEEDFEDEAEVVRLSD